jgi:hypothetical protein
MKDVASFMSDLWWDVVGNLMRISEDLIDLGSESC